MALFAAWGGGRTRLLLSCAAAFVGIVGNGNLAAAEEAVVAEAVEAVEVLPGWVAPYSWPANGITKTHFRENYGGSWDAVSVNLGGLRRAKSRALRNQELHDQIDARHRESAVATRGSKFFETLPLFAESGDWRMQASSGWTARPRMLS